MALPPCRRSARAGTLKMMPIVNSKRAGAREAALRRTTLTCLAFNTAQVYCLRAGERLASEAILRLRRLRQRELGNTRAVIYVAGCYGIFSLEALLALLGTPPVNGSSLL